MKKKMKDRFWIKRTDKFTFKMSKRIVVYESLSSVKWETISIYGFDEKCTQIITVLDLLKSELPAETASSCHSLERVFVLPDKVDSEALLSSLSAYVVPNWAITNRSTEWVASRLAYAAFYIRVHRELRLSIKAAHQEAASCAVENQVQVIKEVGGTYQEQLHAQKDSGLFVRSRK